MTTLSLTLNDGGELICILKKFYKPFKLLCTVYPTNNTETQWQVTKATSKLGRYKGLNWDRRTYCIQPEHQWSQGKLLCNITLQLGSVDYLVVTWKGIGSTSGIGPITMAHSCDSEPGKWRVLRHCSHTDIIPELVDRMGGIWWLLSGCLFQEARGMPIDVWKPAALMNGWSRVSNKIWGWTMVAIATNVITALWGTVCGHGGHIMFD